MNCYYYYRGAVNTKMYDSICILSLRQANTANSLHYYDPDRSTDDLHYLIIKTRRASAHTRTLLELSL